MDKFSAHTRMVLLIVLRNWDRSLSVEGVALELECMGFTGVALSPERIEIALAELRRRIWDLALMPEEATK